MICRVSAPFSELSLAGGSHWKPARGRWLKGITLIDEGTFKFGGAGDALGPLGESVPDLEALL